MVLEVVLPLPTIRIPRTELDVTPICLGTGQFGTGLSRDMSFAIMDAYVEAGGTVLDTGHVYNDFAPGFETSASEKTIGRWRKARGDVSTVVMTKGGHPDLRDGRKRLGPKDLRQDVEEGLEYLGLPQLPIFFLHRDDQERPADEILGALDEMRREGLIKHYGVSNWSLKRILEASTATEKHGYEGFVANQTEWSLARRNPGTSPGTSFDLSAMNDDTIAFHKRTGMAVIAYWAQAKGYFDKYLAGRMEPEAARCYDSPLSRAIADVIGPIAERLKATPTEVMLAAQRKTPFPTIQIAGCRSPAQVRSSLTSLDVQVTAEDVAALNRVAGFAVQM